MYFLFIPYRPFSALFLKIQFQSQYAKAIQAAHSEITEKDIKQYLCNIEIINILSNLEKANGFVL